MTRFAICLGIAFSMSTAANGQVFAKAAASEKAEGAEKAEKPEKSAAKAGAKGGKVAAPTASEKELEKLKGDYKWGMTPDEITAKVQDHVRASFEERLKKTINDPTKQDRVRKEMAAEIERVKTKLIKFDGQKTGYDVSIVDQEFLHGTGESMLATKEELNTRYFFFTNDRLYKMFLAFDKEMLQGKSFREFGQLMQARFGKAKEVTVQEKTKTGVKVKLDHFVWTSKGGDMLRLVDRSEFYDVFCLVIYDGKVAEKQDEVRKLRAGNVRKDNLVESVTTQPSNDRDPHDNVLDQITGKQILKPGEQRAADIVVPSPTPGVRAPTPAEVNRRGPGDEAKADKRRGSKGKDKESDAEDAPKKPTPGKPAEETKGLPL
jgi:hypothetical protein